MANTKTPTAGTGPDLQVERRPIGALALRRNNPRTHSAKQIAQIAASIEAFGFTTPILIDKTNTVVAGHGRLRAARKLGLETVPTIRLDHLRPEQARALVLADNRLAELSGWDRDLLAIEFQELEALDLDFDLEITGFETAEIDLMIEGGGLDAQEADPADTSDGLDLSAPPVTQPGDLWEIGPHRLLCANALERSSYSRLLGRKKARVVFTDPPFNVPIAGHVSGLGRKRHAEFAMASGEMSEVEFTAFLERALAHHAAFSVDGAIHFVCMDWRHGGELLAASRSVYSGLKNVCAWVKTNAGMGSFYRSQHEFVYVFKVGSALHVNNIELGRHGRNRTNVWRYAGANTFGPDRDEALALHPTVKPVRLVADALLDCSRRGDRVLDGFAGSSTTLLAAERTGCIGYGLELEPRYVDASLRRLRTHAGLEARHAETGRSFEQIETDRQVAREAEPRPTTPPNDRDLNEEEK